MYTSAPSQIFRISYGPAMHTAQWQWTREAVTLSGQEGLEIRFRDAQNDFGGAK